MGFVTFTEFISDVQVALGSRSVEPVRVGRSINYAYLDIASAVKFEIFEDFDVGQSTAAGNNTLNVPSGAIQILYIRDTTKDNLLDWVPKLEYYRLSLTERDDPIRWTREKDKLLIHPTPRGVSQMRIGYRKPPARLSGTDTTVIPDYWDLGIFYLSVAHLFYTLDEEQKGSLWFAKAIAYAQSRMTEGDLFYGQPGQGLLMPDLQKSIATNSGEA